MYDFFCAQTGVCACVCHENPLWPASMLNIQQIIIMSQCERDGLIREGGVKGRRGTGRRGVATKINRKPVANIVCCEVSVLCSGYSFWFLIWLFSIGLGPRLVMGCGCVFRLAESGIQSVGIGSFVLDRHGFPAAGTRASERRVGAL